VSAGAGNVADDQPDNTGIAVIRGGMIGRYIVLGLLGKGGMGVVYSAYDPELDRKVALKLLRVANRKKGEDIDAKRARLLREAKAIARLSHPSVVVVYDVGTYQDQVFIAMELVDGMTALRWRDTRKPSWKEILRVFIDAGEGIAAAHVADLIHRDFKPENVMVTREGKVRVMDFGLARTMERITVETTPTNEDGPTLPGVRPAEPRLTHEGNVVGTPAYMPPEQYLGVTDERSDQFSFCVSLYECLYGQHPFEARTSVGLTSNMQAGRVHDAPAGTKVPTWVRKILLKGLKPRPEDRWASMPDMLGALRKDPAIARQRWLMVGGAVAAVGLLLFGMQRAANSRRAFCAAGPERVSAAWELPANNGPAGPHHEAVSKAFLATGKSYAADAVRGVFSLLDDYAVKWVGVYKDACEATNVRGEQSAEVLDLRMDCLNNRLSGMRALVDVFAGASGEVVEHGVEAVHAMSPLEDCNNIKQLKSLIPPPDPSVKERVEELRRELGQAKAVHDAGRYVAALERLKPVVQEARNLKYRPLEAEALARMSLAYTEMGRDNVETERVLDDALRVSVASRHDDLVPEIASNLVWVTAFLGKYAESQRWTDFATGAVERIGGEQSVVNAWILNNTGAAHFLQGHYAQSLEYQQRATAIKEMALGPDDPDFAISLGNLALALNALGRSEEALRVSTRSLAIMKTAEGSAHPHVADEYSNRGEILNRLKRRADALSDYRRALDIWLPERGPDDPLVAYALTGIGVSLTGLDRYPEALDALERALVIRQKHDPDSQHVGETEFALAKALWDGHRGAARSIALARAALTHYGSGPGTEAARADIAAWLAERHASDPASTTPARRQQSTH
jgi:tetratricopeptide (TPR) repeat protein/tRNA A-37 threonylcarbamoyl transferase component Bud32